MRSWRDAPETDPERRGSPGGSGEARIDELWNAEPGTPEAAEFDLWVHFVEDYESEKYPIPLPDPTEAILFGVEQLRPK